MRKPPLEELYAHRSSVQQPPLIVIPGAFGSRLLNSRTGREVWPGSSARLLFSSYEGLEVEIDGSTLNPRAGAIEPYAVFRRGLGRDFYGQLLSMLEGPGGYRRRRPGDRIEATERNYYVYLYDWRLDNVAAVEGLHELIERVRDAHEDPDLRVDILAHSNGGLMARYYARYGTVDHLDSDTASPNFAGAPAIRRLLLVGTPNLGTMQPVLSHVRGEEIGLRRVPPEIVATTSGAPQMMPHPAIPWLVDRRGDVMDRDVFDLETWREFRWSIFAPVVRERTIQRKGGGATGRRYLGMREADMAKHLSRGRNFTRLLATEPDPRDLKPYVFGGDCDETVARLVVEEVFGKQRARERADTVSRTSSGVDYHDAIHDPGDGVVTRSSLLGDHSQRLRRGFPPIPQMRLAHSVFLCEKHQFLTGNATFQNNLLHTLFNATERAS
jgi:pimeloyl-ACP methyl ester carboxylesterase